MIIGDSFVGKITKECVTIIDEFEKVKWGNDLQLTAYC